MESSNPPHRLRSFSVNKNFTQGGETGQSTCSQTSYQKVDGHEGNGPRRYSVDGMITPAFLKGTKVLHVEDIALNRMITQAGVKGNTWSYKGVATGKDAIEEITMDQYDIVLMDIMIEGDMDGYETAEKILQLNPNQLIFASSGSPINTAKAYLFYNGENLGKIGGKEYIYEVLAPALIERRMTILKGGATERK